ncbi:hypothetical protein SAMN05421833_12872 [Microbispora rosea]|uniref:Uncharacterized protein n=1 Tax=Microbispora rosea TaxID=58117 RepID=A0A1N7GF16_9ACTN|nr:hypothetical protein [Microbispora rosea]SIS11138.1 hypothetical protein SAMN05421833_12872 [Microbispora rosea]
MSRAEVIARFQLILPEVDITVVGKGIRATDAVFDHWHARNAALFSDRVTEAAVWYLLGRSLDLAGDPKTALTTDELGEALEVSAVLEEQGMARPKIASVLRLVATARAYCRDTPDATITRKCYDQLRLQVLGEWGLPMGGRTIAWPPTGLTVLKRLGDGYWADALQAIGLHPAFAPPRRPRRRPSSRTSCAPAHRSSRLAGGLATRGDSHRRRCGQTRFGTGVSVQKAAPCTAGGVVTGGGPDGHVHRQTGSRGPAPD